VVPRRLAYPEVLGEHAVYYDGSADALAGTLAQVIQRIGRSQAVCPDARQYIADRYAWPVRAAAMDDALERLVVPDSADFD
jgi:hypothetical protein